MAHTIFFSETTLNGKTQIMSEIEIEGYEHRKFSSSAIHTHENRIYNNLKVYWLGKSDFKKVSDKYELTRTSF